MESNSSSIPGAPLNIKYFTDENFEPGTLRKGIYPFLQQHRKMESIVPAEPGTLNPELRTQNAIHPPVRTPLNFKLQTSS